MKLTDYFSPPVNFSVASASYLLNSFTGSKKYGSPTVQLSVFFAVNKLITISTYKKRRIVD